MKYFIFYSNNTFETVEKIDDTLLRQVEKNVITFIYDIEKSILIGKTEKGTQEFEVPHINTNPPIQPKTNTKKN